MKVRNQKIAINNKARAIEQIFALDPVNKTSLHKLINGCKTLTKTENHVIALD